MKRARIPAPPLTRADLERAIALRGQNLPWSVIADRLGRGRNALEIAVCRYRKGRWAGWHERSHERARAVESFIATTGTVEVPPIARFLGMTVPATYNLMRRLGLDREMREELTGLSTGERRAAATPLTEDEEAAILRRAQEGATYDDLMAESGRSRPTVNAIARGINTDRPSTRANPKRLRRIVLAHAAGIGSSHGAERFGLASPKSFSGLVTYARRRLALATQEASHV